MRLYVETSAAAKLLIEEPESEPLARFLEAAVERATVWHGGRACDASYRQRMRKAVPLIEWAPIVGGLAIAAIVMTWMSAYGVGAAPPVGVAAGVLAAVLLARGRRLLHGALTLLAMALVTWLWITLAGNL